MLVSYEAKVRNPQGAVAVAHSVLQAPPQLWKLQIDTSSARPELVLRHSFMSSSRSDFASLASIFGGENDSLVLRAETGKFPRA